MESNEIKSLIQRYVDAYNAFDVDGISKLLHEDIEFRNISSGAVNVETKGINQFRELAERSKAIFSSRCQKINSYSIAGDQVEVQIDYEGTLATDLPNGLKAGEKLELTGRSIFKIKEGKLVMIEDYS